MAISSAPGCEAVPARSQPARSVTTAPATIASMVGSGCLGLVSMGNCVFEKSQTASARPLAPQVCMYPARPAIGDGTACGSPSISRTVDSMVCDIASSARSLGCVPKGSSISAPSASSAKKV